MKKPLEIIALGLMFIIFSFSISNAGIYETKGHSLWIDVPAHGNEGGVDRDNHNRYGNFDYVAINYCKTKKKDAFHRIGDNLRAKVGAFGYRDYYRFVCANSADEAKIIIISFIFLDGTMKPNKKEFRDKQHKLFLKEKYRKYRNILKHYTKRPTWTCLFKTVGGEKHWYVQGENISEHDKSDSCFKTYGVFRDDGSGGGPNAMERQSLIQYNNYSYKIKKEEDEYKP